MPTLVSHMPEPLKSKGLHLLDPGRIDLGLDRMRRIMERLGSPERAFRSVHIAGTNGKGSTAAMIASALSEAGLRTGLYTSPHLERFSERIRVGGEEISPAALSSLSAAVEAAASLPPAQELTYFEFATAIAFLHFAREKVDIAVVETGLGGRLDATNVIEPLAAVITPVALDHQEYLGSTIEAVAAEKGGIVKEGVPLVLGSQGEASAAVLSRIARARRAECFSSGRDFFVEEKRNGDFDYRGLTMALEGVKVSLAGGHQVENAATALACLELLSRAGVVIGEAALRQGLKKTVWPGRFEIVSEGPDIILDGAHNPAGMARLAETVRERYGGRKGVVVAGFLADKDVEGMLELLAPLAECLILTRPNDERALDPSSDRISGCLSALNLSPHTVPDIGAALFEGRALLGQTAAPFMLVAGSLYLVGAARPLLKGAP